jgi:hypothetical protein
MGQSIVQEKSTNSLLLDVSVYNQIYWLGQQTGSAIWLMIIIYTGLNGYDMTWSQMLFNGNVSSQVHH